MPIGGLSTKLSPLLAKIFVCVSFAWDVGKLGYLEQTVKTVLGYPTSVDVCVVTTSPQKLERVFGTWDVSGERLWVCTESWATDLDDHDYALLWRHRSVLAAAAAGVPHYFLSSAAHLLALLRNAIWPSYCMSHALSPAHPCGLQEIRGTRHTCIWRTTLRCLGER